MFQKIKKISKLRGYGLFTNYHKSLHNFITKKNKFATPFEPCIGVTFFNVQSQNATQALFKVKTLIAIHLAIIIIQITTSQNFLATLYLAARKIEEGAHRRQNY